MARTLHLLLLLLFTSLCTKAQLVSNLQQYTTDNGLPSNGIKGIQWDEATNFLWLATEAGIVRYNGADFKSYTKENMPTLTADRMLFMIRNFKNEICVADQNGNIFFVNENKPVLWQNKKRDVNASLNQYYLLSVSTKFFQEKYKTVNQQNFSLLANQVLPLNDTSCLIVNNNNLLFNSISLNTPIVLPILEKKLNRVFKIGNTIFLKTIDKKIFKFNFYTKEIVPCNLYQEDGVNIQAISSKGSIYWSQGMKNPILIDAEKAWRLSFDGDKLKATLIFTELPEDALIRSLQYSEKNNLLFIGTDSKGLFILSQSKVESKKRNELNSKNRNSYYSQIELANGNILTNEGDIIGTQSSNNIDLPIKGKFSYNISYTNHDSLLWYNRYNEVLKQSCVYACNTVSHQTIEYQKLKAAELVLESENKIYLASQYGIGFLEADSMHYLLTSPKRNAGNILFDFKQINTHELALATCDGLLRFNTLTNKLDTIFKKPNTCVRSIWKYKDYLFFGTYGSGFYISKNGRLKEMPLDKKKYLLYAHCFVLDDEGFCWISTNRGLFKASISELLEVYEKNTDNVYYHYYGKKDGMEMTELNGGCTPCALMMKNKTISFPTMDGLLWVKPEKAKPILPEGAIFVDEVLVDNTVYDTDQLSSTILKAGTTDISIKLAFAAWSNQENIYLEYQLNDTLKWKPVTLGNQSEIQFTNLPAGNYTLTIRKLNGFGFNNYTYKKIQFSIASPWYQQWWFYLLCALTLFGIIGLYLKLRTMHFKQRERKLEQQVLEKTKELQQQNEVLEKNNSIKTRLISIISHDIVTPLKFVTAAGKNLLEKRALMPTELQQETLQEITNTSQQLQLLSTNILNWIKYQNENRRLVKETFQVKILVDEVFGILQSLAKQKQLQLINQVDETLEVTQYYEPLKILIYNLLTNAIQYSSNGHVTITNNFTKEGVVLHVADTGQGMTQEQIQNIIEDRFTISAASVDSKKGHGLGYMIIKDLIKTMGASIHINSEKNKGTTVSIVMPK